MLSAHDLSYQYGEGFEICELSINVESGRILGLVGKSGSGKSTILRLLAGFLEPKEGEIRVRTEKVHGPSKRLVPGHPKIKLMTQANTLFPNICIGDNIAFEVKTFTQEYQQKRVKYLAKQFGLTHLLDKYPRECSGGELQRVMLAKVLADEPWALLLDEPFANLDSINKRTAMNFLQKTIKRENISTVFVSHDSK
ncbi:MAG: ATP-binding cassette domain-containing protein, partial [Leadbetterella sp.]